MRAKCDVVLHFQKVKSVISVEENCARSFPLCYINNRLLTQVDVGKSSRLYSQGLQARFIQPESAEESKLLQQVCGSKSSCSDCKTDEFRWMNHLSPEAERLQLFDNKLPGDFVPVASPC